MAQRPPTTPKKWKKPFQFDTMLSLLKTECCHLLCRSTLIMTCSPFSNAVTFGKHNPTLVSYHPWKEDTREIAGQTQPTYSTSHPLSPRNDGSHKLMSYCHNLPDGLWRWEVHIWPLFLASFFFYTETYLFISAIKGGKKGKEEGTEMLYLPLSSIFPVAPCWGINWSWK